LAVILSTPPTKYRKIEVYGTPGLSSYKVYFLR